MRRLNRTLFCALAFSAPCAAALALPPPPYAAEAAQGGGQASAQGFDRYGGGGVRAAAPEAAPQPERRALAWSAKTEGFQEPLKAPLAPLAPLGPVAASLPAPGSAPLPPPPIRRVAAVGGQTQGPRFYSVHRDYGIEPDPIPLAPQFFGPTADVTEPATLPLRRAGQRPLVADQGVSQ